MKKSSLIDRRKKKFEISYKYISWWKEISLPSTEMLKSNRPPLNPYHLEALCKNPTKQHKHCQTYPHREDRFGGGGGGSYDESPEKLFPVHFLEST